MISLPYSAKYSRLVRQGILSWILSYHLRLVKPLDLSMGIEEAFLLWGLRESHGRFGEATKGGTGVPFYMKKYSLFSPV
jgi:hypothetical protein